MPEPIVASSSVELMRWNKTLAACAAGYKTIRCINVGVVLIVGPDQLSGIDLNRRHERR